MGRRCGKIKPQGSFLEYSRELLNHERGSVPQKGGASVRIALVYPNSYGVGMANLGFQTVYRIFNDHPNVRCERAFVFESPFDHEVRTLESKERLARFDVIGFSLSFELDLVNIIRCLLMAGIPTLAGDRTERDPLVIFGGAVAGLNPSPLLPYLDGLLVGEGEGIFHLMSDVFHRSGKKRNSREAKLRALAEIDGVFVPTLNSTVKRQKLDVLECYPTYTPMVTPLSHFENMFVVEVGRGCTRGCLFCAAQKVYQPYRFRSVDSIVETVAGKNPGAKRVGLEGAGLSDYPHLEGLCESLIDMEHELSFSSIRPDRLQPELLELLERGGVRTIAMAPETGSEKLRYNIGKRISDKVLKDCVYLLANSSMNNLKLYFMIGLPGETDDDIQAIIDVVLELSGIFSKYQSKKRIRVSVNAFVPKPFTEFQWATMDNEKALARKRKMIIQGLKGKKGITIVTKSSREEIIQGILSLGDERVGFVLLDVVRKGIPMKRAMKENGIDVDSLLYRERSLAVNLPWDFIESDVKKENLWTRYQKYMNLLS